ncbi:MAG: FdhF/YdeP family oxidoreductase, partial [Phycisphaerales bacterium]|nr:FdhF/YdeP family oxidoreductase [Phycisphaerales bacterium]
QLRAFTPRELEAAGRLTRPMYAGPLDLNYRPLSWDEALDRIATKMRRTAPDESFFYFSGRSSNEAGFLLQLVARLYGTNNVNNCSYYCHQASGVGLGSVTGSGTATVVLDDIEGCDLVFLIGANPSSNHPRLMTTLKDLKRRRGTVVVVNPLREVGLCRFKVPSDVRSMLFGTKIADEYIQPHIGGDIAFLTGVAKAVIERGGVDEAFVTSHADGWPEFERHVRAIPWREIVARSGIDQATIWHIAEVYRRSKHTIFCWAMGITHHEHGVENVQMIANLAMMRGMLGRPHAGLLPLRGHSNVQGMGSMGVTPELKDAVLDRIESEFGVVLPKTPGLDTMGCMVRADEGRCRFAMCLGGNLYGSNPDSRFAARALGRIDMTVCLSTTLNTGHVRGRGKETIILPVLARDEEPQPTTQESMFNFVRLSDGGTPRLDGPRAEVQVIADLAERVVDDHGALDWTSMREYGRIRDAIGKIIPGYEAIGRIDRTKNEFQIAGRTFHDATFATDTGRAKFHAIDLPELRGTGAHELRLMTVRSEGQFNTVVYEEYDLYRGQDRRDVILMNAHDMRRLGFATDQRVSVTTDTGAMTGLLARAIDIPPGNAVMYYPEANVLIPRATDRKSGTPSFKNIVVRVNADQSPATSAS